MSCVCIPTNAAQRSVIMRELRTELGNHHCRGCPLFAERWQPRVVPAITTAAELEELAQSQWEITPAGREALKSAEVFCCERWPRCSCHDRRLA